MVQESRALAALKRTRVLYLAHTSEHSYLNSGAWDLTPSSGLWHQVHK